MKSLRLESDSILRFLSAKRAKLFLLDFDGTLAPIVSTPDEARLDGETKRTLTILNKSPRHHLVIISGRSLKDLFSLIRIKNVIYAGNHGLEIKGGNSHLSKQAKKARKLKSLIHRLAQALKTAFRDYEGVFVENKNFTISLHFRNLLPEQNALFNGFVSFFKKEYKKYPVTWVKGKKVWEIRPDYCWGKGDTVLDLMKRFPGAYPVVIGDDTSDEDMFRAVKRCGITIRVGHLKGSQADYYLNSTKEVKVFLKKLCR
jgi:trehalose 6-phosphate phosphatase